MRFTTHRSSLVTRLLPRFAGAAAIHIADTMDSRFRGNDKLGPCIGASCSASRGRTGLSRYLLLSLLVLSATHLRAQPLDSGAILFRYEGRSLHDSKWGRIAELQRALNRALQGCGRSAVDTD